LILFLLETYNLYSIASQLKRVIDPVTSGISLPGQTIVYFHLEVFFVVKYGSLNFL